MESQPGGLAGSGIRLGARWHFRDADRGILDFEAMCVEGARPAGGGREEGRKRPYYETPVDPRPLPPGGIQRV